MFFLEACYKVLMRLKPYFKQKVKFYLRVVLWQTESMLLTGNKTKHSGKFCQQQVLLTEIVTQPQNTFQLPDALQQIWAIQLSPNLPQLCGAVWKKTEMHLVFKHLVNEAPENKARHIPTEETIREKNILSY